MCGGLSVWVKGETDWTSIVGFPARTYHLKLLLMYLWWLNSLAKVLYFKTQDPAVEFVVARYDLDKVYRELLVSLIVPIVLFVVSSISLCIITKLVKVITK